MEFIWIKAAKICKVNKTNWRGESTLPYSSTKWQASQHHQNEREVKSDKSGMVTQKTTPR